MVIFYGHGWKKAGLFSRCVNINVVVSCHILKKRLNRLSSDFEVTYLWPDNDLEYFLAIVKKLTN